MTPRDALIAIAPSPTPAAAHTAQPWFVVEGLHSDIGGPFELSLSRGDCACILGKSGSGKSVFLRLLADMDPGTGRVQLGGRDRHTWPAPDWRRQVVYQAAEPAWWAPTAADHFEPSDQALIAELLPALDLDPALLVCAIEQLSTGERQRLALLRSLLRRPAVLLLDEPTASLDQASTERVEALLKKQLAAGLALVLVTHSPEQAGRMGRQLFEMRDQQLHRRP